MFRLFDKHLPDNAYTRSRIELIRQNVRPLIGTEIPPVDMDKFALYHKTGSRVEYEADYFETRRRLCAFTALSLWEDDPVWLNELEKALRALLSEPTWALPAHCAPDADDKARRETLDLFACETAEAIAEILSLLDDRLDPALCRDLRAALRERTIDAYLTSRRKWGKNNWSSVCGGCLAMVFMYEAPELLEDALSTLKDSLELFLSSYNSDGCCMEGPLYWTYGFGFFVYAADMLRAYTGGKIDVFKDKKVKAIADFGFNMFLGGAHVIPLADASHELYVHVGLMHRLVREYGKAAFPSETTCDFGRDVRFRFAPFIRDFYWYDPALDGPMSAQQAHTLYRGAGWSIHRREGYTVVCKGGCNAEPHNHNDLGSLIVYSEGKFLLDDPGWPEYTKEYFGARRYEDFVCASSAGHSVPIVNGLYQAAGEDRRARLLTSARNEACYDLSSAYDAEGLFLRRTVRLDDNCVLIIDHAEGAQSFVERFVTRIPPVIEGESAVIADWRLSADVPVSVTVATATYNPRFKGFATLPNEEKETETLYQIDLIPKEWTGDIRVSFVKGEGQAK